MKLKFFLLFKRRINRINVLVLGFALMTSFGCRLEDAGEW